jgi:hypothetical protein
MVSNSIENKEDRGEQLRETWRQVMSVRRSALQFRSRLARTLPTIEEEVGRDPHLGDVVTTITVLVRILDWTMGELKDVYPPQELFEVIVLPTVARLTGMEEATSGTG